MVNRCSFRFSDKGEFGLAPLSAMRRPAQLCSALSRLGIRALLKTMEPSSHSVRNRNGAGHPNSVDYLNPSTLYKSEVMRSYVYTKLFRSRENCGGASENRPVGSP